MSAPETVQRLIDRFAENQSVYKSASYNETQLRREFLDPLFKSLGWDIDNEQGYAEQWKEVVHEDSLKVGDGTRAPDYSFRLGGRRLFFLEAKKPAVNLKDDPSPAYQLRRYAWTAKMPVSILSDFEEFIVYDTRTKPVAGDPASTARTFYLNYTDYLHKWDEIAGIFSPEAIKRGAFDKYVESATKKRGTAEVDDAFLAEIEEWRELLARNIALRNPGLTQRDLNFAVQRTIDRIIFLRISEDRGIEEYGRLRKIGEGKDLYRELCVLFQRADEKYNSGLFHFTREKGRPEEPDTLTPRLAIDDKVLKAIFKRLYYPDSPYEFSVFPPEILGHVYERFLGSVIRLTPGGQAKVEQKPEVRKAGGVYYTPTYIVDYIVKHTVGRLLEGKSPQDAAGRTDTWQVSKTRRPLAVLDPACGSGSFLLGAYQFLLNWYLEQYSQDPKAHTKGKEPRLYQDHRGAWRLTTAERKRILIDHIHGVDIDPQAVEVTKLSLLLKVLENENAETLQKQLDLFHDRALPDLANNIKCGNSLIGPDFYQNRQAGMFDEEEMYRVNAFDWKAEFPGMMGSGGFDAVIGNPPYLGGREWNEKSGRRYEYLVEHYEVADYQFDIYVLFWERAVRIMRTGGYCGMITPNTWLNNQSCTALRKFLLDKTSVRTVVDYSRTKVFTKAVVLPIVTIVEKSRSDGAIRIEIPESGEPRLLHEIPQVLWKEEPQHIFNINLSPVDAILKQKIELDSCALEGIAEVRFGIKLYETGKGTPPQKATDAKEHVFESDHQIDDTYRPYLEGKDINRYQTNWKRRWLKYGKNLAAPRDTNLFEGTRLLFRRIVGERLIGTLCDSEYVTSQLLQIVKPNAPESAKTILGILNSTLIAYYFRKRYNRQDKTFPEIRIYELRSLPIKNNSLVTQDPKLAMTVQRMLDLHNRLASTKTAHEKTLLQRQVAATDREIDQLVYQLYGLTEEEIRIVEGKE